MEEKESPVTTIDDEAIGESIISNITQNHEKGNNTSNLDDLMQRYTSSILINNILHLLVTKRISSSDTIPLFISINMSLIPSITSI